MAAVIAPGGQLVRQALQAVQWARWICPWVPRTTSVISTNEAVDSARFGRHRGAQYRSGENDFPDAKTYIPIERDSLWGIPSLLGFVRVRARRADVTLG